MSKHPLDKLTAEDWRWIREEAERMRSEVNEEDFEAGETPSEAVMTSLGYVELMSGFEEGEGSVLCHGRRMDEADWPCSEDEDEEAE